jgi:hypothetical protein
MNGNRANYEPPSFALLRQSFVAEGPPLMHVIVPGTEESSASYAAKRLQHVLKVVNM